MEAREKGGGRRVVSGGKGGKWLGGACVPPSLAKQREHYHPSKQPRVRTSPPSFTESPQPSTTFAFVSTVYDSLDPFFFIWFYMAHHLVCVSPSPTIFMHMQLCTIDSCFCWVYMNLREGRRRRGGKTLAGSWLSYSFHSLRRIDVAADAAIVGVVHQPGYLIWGWDGTWNTTNVPRHSMTCHPFSLIFFPFTLAKVLPHNLHEIFDYFTNNATCDSSACYR